MQIDLNCDLGEGAGNDLLIIPHIARANIACGGHAGTIDTMKDTVASAMKYGVKIGAHPGYPDPDHFGRVSLNMSRADLHDSIIGQVRTLKQITEGLGGKLVHVKPHGALYNDAARDPAIARIIADAVFRVDPGLIFVGLSGSVMITAAEECGLKTAHEVFADRTYTDEGFLVPRTHPDALIADINKSISQVTRMILKGEVVSLNGKVLPIRADTVCLHGDQPGAPELAKALRLTAFQRLSTLKYHPLGDTAFLIRLGDTISPEINRQVHALANRLREVQIPGLTEVIPAYADVLAIYNPEETNRSDFLAGIEDAVNSRALNEDAMEPPEPEILDIPVVYGGECGPDLEAVARHAGISEEEVIRRHAKSEYRVYLMGFTPGFCYLGGLDESLHTPRKSEPRLKVPAGSVGIAGSQTGIYPIESPGGWQIIGRTPLTLFDPDRSEPFLCRAGMNIRFQPATRNPPFGYAQGPVPERSRRATDNRPPSAINDQPSVKVVDPGLLTTIQDAGRPGYRAFGMPVSGALDPGSMRLANWLVGNPADEAVLELTFKGPELEFLADKVIALAGADMRPVAGGKARATGVPIQVHRGDRLSFAGLIDGARTYLAIAGGFDVPVVMGSRSTYLRGKLGGYRGRALQAGDEICTGHGNPPIEPVETDNYPSLHEIPKETHSYASLKRFLQMPSIIQSASIRYIPGPESDRFTMEGLRTFLGSEFAVSPNSDRMGIRLDGPSVEHQSGADILSSGVIPGTIQVPGDGKPIILMNDCQTTGGYARIGCVIRQDLQVLAQLRPGQKIRFVQVSIGSV